MMMVMMMMMMMMMMMQCALLLNECATGDLPGRTVPTRAATQKKMKCIAATAAVESLAS